MRAAIGAVPDTDDDRWAYEVKWDGIRALGFVEHVDDTTRLRLQSSNLLDITVRYPELAPLADELAGHTAVLDGEIVTFNADGRPDFGLLQQRMHVNDRKTVGAWASRQPVVWILFDLLFLDGNALYAHDRTPAIPYEDRHRLLEDLIGAGPNWQVPRAQFGDGAELLRAVAERNMEGLIAKRLGSAYEPGKRSPNWRKLKVRRRQEFVVGGWKPGEGGRANTIGALLVGYHTPDGHLAYAGGVGSGLRDNELRRLQLLFAGLTRDECPFEPAPTAEESRHVSWLEPSVVVEVAFGEWSIDGRLRHPSYVGQRDDKDPREITREE